jgi:hypothetical protein
MRREPKFFQTGNLVHKISVPGQHEDQHKLVVLEDGKRSSLTQFPPTMHPGLGASPLVGHKTRARMGRLQATKLCVGAILLCMILCCFDRAHTFDLRQVRSPSLCYFFLILGPSLFRVGHLARIAHFLVFLRSQHRCIDSVLQSLLQSNTTETCLYVADSTSATKGVIWAYDANGTAVFSLNVTTPTALAVDHTRQRLYAAIATNILAYVPPLQAPAERRNASEVPRPTGWTLRTTWRRCRRLVHARLPTSPSPVP